jgi:tetratricopeptide (TPR) repeat protein
MTRIALLPVIALFIWSLLTVAVRSESPPIVNEQVLRRALVIGNGDYQSERFDLPNAVIDAELIGETLRELGFDVTLLSNASLADFSKDILSFASGLEEGSIALVYFAGHGIQWRGENYLIPVDARLRDLAELDWVSVTASELIATLAGRQTLANIFIFDACRNNPFEDAANRTLRDGATARGPDGLSGLAPTNIHFSGTLVAYSTAPGDVSSDGLPGQHSPYARALSGSLVRPGLGIESVFKLTRSLVMGATSHAQIPWENSSLVREVYLVPENTNSALEPTLCDIEAGHRSDPQRLTPGVPFLYLRPAVAIPACEAALQEDPENPRLMTQLARAFLKEGRFEEALELNRTAAEMGYVAGYHNMGNHYRLGAGVKRDMDKALEWFLISADAGHAEDAYNVGLIFMQGTAKMPKDFERAYVWLDRAAKQDWAKSFGRLGILHREGLGVAPDQDRANALFARGAELGNASAMVNLGTAYREGTGVEIDYARAYGLFHRAAFLRRRSAYTNLGDMNRKGQGREPDLKEAAFWYGVAARQGHEYSLEQFRNLMQDFDARDQEAINERIQFWLDSNFG